MCGTVIIGSACLAGGKHADAVIPQLRQLNKNEMSAVWGLTAPMKQLLLRKVTGTVISNQSIRQKTF